MNKEIQEALSKVISMAFEELGFVFPAQEMSVEQANADPEIAVEVSFYGPFRGKIILQVCGGLLAAIATNMLAQDTPVALNLQQDAIKELANVLCGNFLPLIVGPEEIFHLDPPKILELNGFSLDRRIAEMHIGIEQGRADLYLFVDDPDYLSNKLKKS